MYNNTALLNIQHTNYDQFIDYTNDRLGQDIKYSINCDKINKLGWYAKMKLNTQITNIVKYYKERFVW